MPWSVIPLAALVWLVGTAASAEGALRLGMVLEPPHLDPTAGAAAAIDEVVYANLFQGLTRIDANGGVQPALARAWTVDGAGTTYTFDLEEGVTFHDGTGFDAEDVVFTFDRLLAEDSTNAQKGLYAGIIEVEAPNPNEVRFTLDAPDGQFLFNLGLGDAVIVAPESAADNKTSPVGTGPFQFEGWARGNEIVLRAREDYWGDPVGLDHVNFRIVADPAAAVAAMLAGDLDAYPNFPAPESLEQLKQDPRLKVVVGTTEGETILAINNRNKPLGDVRVRRAIAHAIDRNAVIEGAYFGYGTPIGSHFAPHHPAYRDLTGRYPYDPDEARALLAEAGVEDLRLRLKLPPPAYARRSGEIVAAELRDVGIEVETTMIEWPQWLEQVFTNHDFDLTIVAHTEPLDIDVYARPDYYFGYQSAAFDAIIADLRRALDPAERNALYGRAQEQIAEDGVNGFLFQLPKLGVWDARLEGLWPNSPIQANDVTDVRWTSS